jgi:hypothetical protein
MKAAMLVQDLLELAHLGELKTLRDVEEMPQTATHFSGVEGLGAEGGEYRQQFFCGMRRTRIWVERGARKKGCGQRGEEVGRARRGKGRGIGDL